MKRLCNSNFELIQNIIKEVDFSEKLKIGMKVECIDKIWKEITNDMLSKVSYVLSMSKDEKIKVVCCDSYVANEFYLEKDKILSKLREKTEKMGIKIKDIIFDYKKWKDKNYEKEI